MVIVEWVLNGVLDASKGGKESGSLGKWSSKGPFLRIYDLFCFIF